MDYFLFTKNLNIKVYFYSLDSTFIKIDTLLFQFFSFLPYSYFWIIVLFSRFFLAYFFITFYSFIILFLFRVSHNFYAMCLISSCIHLHHFLFVFFSHFILSSPFSFSFSILFFSFIYRFFSYLF